ncbi:MAG TPA: hypothetical protein VK177_07150 [Flavobacteriales bacterium]|nr:hypothetical protein [Flavobacteriales bacterium]
MRYTSTILILILLFVYACSSNEEKKAEACKKPGEVTNPNGMSELSQIMEEWYAALKAAGDSIKVGKFAKNIPAFDEKKPLTAQTSQPDMRKDNFGPFLEQFFYNYNNLRKATDGYAQASEFNLTVKACVNCHEQYCHGPIVRINKLRIADI